MPRIRTVKPDAWQDPKVGRLSPGARLLWVVLITLADDDGRFMALPSVIYAHGYPHDDDALSQIPEHLAELSAAGLLVLYTADGVPYGWHPRWADHQKINRYTPSRLPEPPAHERSRPVQGPPVVRTHGGLTETSRPDRKGEDRKGEEEDSAHERVVTVVPPPVQVPAEIDRACDTLAAAGLHVHDRTTVKRMADQHPQVDIEEAAIRCAAWLRASNRKVRHPLRALEPFVTADDAPQSQQHKAAAFAEYGETA